MCTSLMSATGLEGPLGYCSVSELLSALKINASAIIKLVLSFVQPQMHGIFISCLKSTRSITTTSLNVPKCNTTVHKRFYSPRVLALWNRLPAYIQECDSLPASNDLSERTYLAGTDSHKRTKIASFKH